MLKQIKSDLEKIYQDHPRRLAHIKGVAETAIKLGKQHHIDIEKLEIAALLHDITKYYTLEENKEIIIKNYDNHEEIIKEFNEKILHSFTARIIAQERYHIKDIDILDSILYHTIGKEKMTLYEQIIFISDYTEPNRTYESCVKVREIAFEDLDKATYQAIHDYIIYHEKHNQYIPKQARNAYKYYKEVTHG